MSADAGKRPAFQFYPGDWLRDEAVRACTLPARGLWMDMLCYAHFSEPYGHLRTRTGQPITVAELARMVGAPRATVAKLLRELEANGVLSKTDDGTYYSRRMVRDERIRTARAAGGPKSLENPNVPRPKGPPEGLREGPSEGYPSPPSLGGSPAFAIASSKEKEEAPSPSSSSPEDLRRLWNETTTEPIPRAVELTPQRRRHSVACLRERGIDGMRQVFARVNASPFCRGQNDRGWLATFEWALKPDNIAKVLEGKYDPRPNQRPQNEAAVSSLKRVPDPAKQRYGAMEFGK